MFFSGILSQVLTQFSSDFPSVSAVQYACGSALSGKGVSFVHMYVIQSYSLTVGQDVEICTLYSYVLKV